MSKRHIRVSNKGEGGKKVMGIAEEEENDINLSLQRGEHKNQGVRTGISRIVHLNKKKKQVVNKTAGRSYSFRIMEKRGIFSSQKERQKRKKVSRGKLACFTRGKLPNADASEIPTTPFHSCLEGPSPPAGIRGVLTFKYQSLSRGVHRVLVCGG